MRTVARIIMVSTALLACAAVAGPGTPFYEVAGAQPPVFRFHTPTLAGLVSSDGLHLQTARHSVVRWGITDAQPWSISADSPSMGTLHDLRGGQTSEPAQLFTSLSASLGEGQPSLHLQREGDGVKTTVIVRPGSAVRFFYEGVDRVDVSEARDALELPLRDGVLREKGLRCFEESLNASREIACRFTAPVRVGDRRFEYSVIADRVDPSTPLFIDPTFEFTDAFGGPGRDFGPMLAVGDDSADPSVIIAGETVSGFLGWGLNLNQVHGNPRADAGFSSPDDPTSDFIVIERPSNGGPWLMLLVGGDGQDTPRGLSVEVGLVTKRICIVGSTTSSLSSLTGNGSSISLVGPVNDGGVASNAFVWCKENVADAEFIVFGGSGRDEALGFTPLGDERYAVVGRSASSNLPRLCFASNGCVVSDAGSGLIGEVDFRIPVTSKFTLYPLDGGAGRISAIVPSQQGGFHAAGLFGPGRDVSLVIATVVRPRAEVLSFSSLITPPNAVQAYTGAFTEVSSASLAPTADGTLYLTVQTTSAVDAGTVITPFHSKPDGGNDAVLARLQTSPSLTEEWVTHLGSSGGDFPLALTASKEGDAIVGGYVLYHAGDDFNPLGRAGARTLNGTTYMFFTQVAADAGTRYRTFFGGPEADIRPDQIRSLLYLPSTDGGAIDSLYLGLGLQGENGPENYPALDGGVRSDFQREMGLSRVFIDTSRPVFEFEPTVEGGPSVRYRAVSSGPAPLRSVRATLTAPDGGQTTENSALSPPVASFEGRLLASAGEGLWTISVSALSDDGFDSSGELQFVFADVVVDGGTDAGVVDGGESDGGEEPDPTEPSVAGQSPVGFTCGVGAGELALMAAAACAALLRRRRVE